MQFVLMCLSTCDSELRHLNADSCVGVTKSMPKCWPLICGLVLLLGTGRIMMKYFTNKYKLNLKGLVVL